MPVSDEELSQLQERNTQLRKRIKEARAERRDNELQVSNEVTAIRLEAEAAELQAELDLIQQGSSVGDLQSTAASTLTTAKQQMEAAALAERAKQGAQTPAPEVPSVDEPKADKAPTAPEPAKAPAPNNTGEGK